MENTKRTIILLLCLIFAFSPLVTLGTFSYAENTPSAGGGGGYDWVPVSDNDGLVASFKAYCRSRNLDISHVPNTVKSIVTWDYHQLELYAGLNNIDLTGLQAHIWYAYDNNNFIKFFFDQTGCSILSRLYGAIVSAKGLTDNSQKTLYKGDWFEDDDGNGAFCYIGASNNIPASDIANYKLGTLYRTSGAVLYDWVNAGETTTYYLKKNGVTYPYYLAKGDSTNNVFIQLQSNSTYNPYFNLFNAMYGHDDRNEVVEGNLAIIKLSENDHRYYLGSYNYVHNTRNDTFIYNITNFVELARDSGEPAQIDASQGDTTNPPTNKNLIINTQDTTINNYITNNNITNNTYDYTDDNPLEPPVYTDPYDNNPTGGILGPDGSINFQMPDLNIDWHLNLNTNNLPFPFSIPYDMINFFNAFSAEPVAPHIQENVTIANMTIPIDIDLEWLDDVAGYFRTFVLLIYVFGLIIATRALFHIY